MLKLGTKWPSIMSRCRIFAPAAFQSADFFLKMGKIARQQRRNHQRHSVVQISKHPVNKT